MRKSRFTESQIIDILKQGEAGVPIAEILRQHNIPGRILSFPLVKRSPVTSRLPAKL